MTHLFKAILATLDPARFRATDEFLVVSYSDYRRRDENGHKQHGPAEVYFKQDDISEAVTHYGWSLVRLPPEHFWTILNDMPPARVRYL